MTITSQCHLARAGKVAWCFSLLALSAIPNSRVNAQPTLPTVRVSAPPVIKSDSTDQFGALRLTVGADQVRDLDAVDLAAAMRRVPGLTITRWNPIGAFGGGSGGSVFVRGHGTGRPGSELKTYIDGVPFYMGVWNHPLLDLLPVGAMQNIVVHKGPQPQVVGNGFSAIRMTSRRAELPGTQGDISVSTGAFNTRIQQANATIRRGIVGLSASQGYAQSDGHRANANGRLANGLLRADVDIRPALRLSLTGMLVDNSAGDPGVLGKPVSRTGRFDTRGSLLSATLHHTTGTAARGMEGEVQLYRSAGHADWYDQPAPDGNTLASFALSGVRFRENVTPWRGGSVVAGLDIDHIDGAVQFDRIAPARPSSFDAPTFQITQPYVAFAHRVDFASKWTITPSIGTRAYVHNRLADEIAPHAGLVVEHDRTLSVRAQWSRGVNYPGLEVTALSALIPPLGSSWERLQPERMKHAEVGVNLQRSVGDMLIGVDAAAFRDDLTDRYVFAFPPISMPPSFLNLGAYRIRGLETSITLQGVGDLSFFGSGSWLNSTRVALPGAPARSFSGGVVWAPSRFRLTVDANGQSSMFANTLVRAASEVNTARVSGFTVWHSRLAIPITRLGSRTELFVSADNLFDRTYEYIPGYPMPGRWFTFGARVGH